MIHNPCGATIVLAARPALSLFVCLASLRQGESHNSIQFDGHKKFRIAVTPGK